MLLTRHSRPIRMNETCYGHIIDIIYYVSFKFEIINN